MLHDHTVAAITAALSDLNAAGATATHHDLQALVLAMIELVARSTIDANAEFAELLR